jgi:Protein of unknown function (DUF3830)
VSDLRITTRDLAFTGRLERTLAPKTCEYFQTLLPYTNKAIHVKWSGEGCFIPLGDLSVPFGFENATCYPAPGHMLFYPGGYGETEILLAYGSVNFVSKVGQLAGNHFLTVVDNLDKLAELGRRTSWDGAQDILIERI